MSRRLMLRNADSGFVPFPVSPWTLRKQINNNGSISSGNGTNHAATSNFFYSAKQGDQFVRTSSNTDPDGITVNVVIHEYKAQSESKMDWLRREFLLEGDVYTIVSAQCNFVRFTCAYQSTAGKTMTQAIIGQCFAVSKKEG